MDSKTCTGCIQVLPITHFNKQPGGKDGLKSKCKDCVREILYKWRKEHPDRFRKVGWAYELRTLYGITVEEYDNILLSQNNACAICLGQNVVRFGKPLKFAVDHNHETGKVRGLLCDSCNRGIGHLKELTNMQRAITYLEKYDGQ